ncbi:MAG: FAD-dependent oxidoreductase, partial [Candidatus Brocadiia bacterium]|nr:FAD-dependent oxidoreductase [Candidatus Brocadiia bacterium]
MQTKNDVLVVGGGVIGAACAYYLTGRGATVTVIDRGEVGHGCSYGNGGLIVPSHSFPLPMPGAVYQGFRWLFDPDSPFYIKPRFNWQLIRWLLRFARCSTKKQMLHAVRALTTLSLKSRALYDDIGESAGDRMHFKKYGSLYPCQTTKGLDHAVYEMETLRPYGVAGRLLDKHEVLALEPAITGPLIGGTYFEGDAHAEPLATVQTLLQLAAEQGARVEPGTELIDWELRNRRIDAVRTTRGTLRADQFVL